MINSMMGAARRRVIRSLMPDVRLLPAVGVISTPAGRALAADYRAKIRFLELIAPPAYKMALHIFDQGAAGDGSPFIAP